MKILCVLYDDPKGGMPKSYPLKDLPKLEKYPDGMTLPSPKGRDFNPGELLGCVSGELGLRKFLESNGHELVVTNSKDGDGCEADKHIVDADIVISQPFFPYYLTKERIAKAKNLKMAITAGIGSDHVDLQAAMDNKIDVVEVTFCNSRSVAEHIVMMIVSMVRDYHNQHRIVNEGGWNIADAVQRSYDVEGMHIGTVAAGRIGLDALRKMKPFDVHLHYFDRYKTKQDFIQKYIFPGGFLPSKNSLNKYVSDNGLTIKSYDSYADHYANTLAIWKNEFNRKWDLIKKQGFDLTFKRMWEFYLSYCEAGFKSKNIDLIQFSIQNK